MKWILHAAAFMVVATVSAQAQTAPTQAQLEANKKLLLDIGRLNPIQLPETR